MDEMLGTGLPCRMALRDSGGSCWRRLNLHLIVIDLLLVRNPEYLEVII
eukprot:SAG31_NODE_103_length_25164_cov_12.124317_12_plen_49_part_00